MPLVQHLAINLFLRLPSVTPPILLLLGDNLLTAVAVSQSSNMVASHHHIVVVEATDGHALNYHIISDHNVNHTLNHDHINDGEKSNLALSI